MPTPITLHDGTNKPLIWDSEDIHWPFCILQLMEHWGKASPRWSHFALFHQHDQEPVQSQSNEFSTQIIARNCFFQLAQHGMGKVSPLLTLLVMRQNNMEHTALPHTLLAHKHGNASCLLVADPPLMMQWQGLNK